MFSFFKKEKWVLVKSIKEVRTGYQRSYTYYIHLYESEKGNRKAEYICDGEPYDINKKGNQFKTTDTYQLKIHRWLSGRKDPEIPAYSEISEEDTVNYLKGTVWRQ